MTFSCCFRSTEISNNQTTYYEDPNKESSGNPIRNSANQPVSQINTPPSGQPTQKEKEFASFRLTVAERANLDILIKQSTDTGLALNDDETVLFQKLLTRYCSHVTGEKENLLTHKIFKKEIKKAFTVSEQELDLIIKHRFQPC